MNIEYVLNDDSTAVDQANLYTDKGKRELFVQHFALPNDTQELITMIEGRIDTWAAMVDELCYQISL